jgi:hypothetical protein
VEELGHYVTDVVVQAGFMGLHAGKEVVTKGIQRFATRAVGAKEGGETEAATEG